MRTTFESEALIRFPDCDPFNHLNNARYLDYFINAREDHLRTHLGFNIYQFAATRGISWVVAANYVAYLRPACLMETIVIDSTLIAWRERDLQIEMRMWDHDKTTLKAVLWCRFTHIDLKTGRSIAHSAELTAMFKPLEAPLPDPGVTFDERVAGLRAAHQRAKSG